MKELCLIGSPSEFSFVYLYDVLCMICNISLQPASTWCARSALPLQRESKQNNLCSHHVVWLKVRYTLLSLSHTHTQHTCVFYYSGACLEWGKVQKYIRVNQCSFHVQMLCSNVILKSSDVFMFPGKKEGYASDAALMPAPEPKGAAGSSASTETAVQKRGSWG